MNVHLLAHGSQERLPIGLPKQFLEVGGERIIARTIRLLIGHGYRSPVIVAPRTQEWAGFCMEHGLERKGLEEPLPDIVGSIGKIVETPGDHLFLLADVTFSKSALESILKETPVWTCYGKPGPNLWTGKSYSESYALRVPDEFRGPVSNFALLPHGRKRNVHFLRTELCIPLMEIGDWTDDIDNVDDLERIRPKLDAFARAEA